LTVKEEQEFYQLLLHILLVTICDVIKYCASSEDMRKITVYDEIVINI